MLRSLFTLALSVFLLAETSAKTAPAATVGTHVKSAKAMARASRRAAKKAERLASKKAASAPVANDGWPPLDDSRTAVASVTPTDATYGGAGAGSRGEIDNANVYAAPGMPVHMRTSRGIVPYSVRPARKAASQTTLTPGN